MRVNQRTRFKTIRVIVQVSNPGWPNPNKGENMSILNLNGGFLGDIEVHYSVLPAEPQNDAKEDIDIYHILINGKGISQLSQEYLLDVHVYFEPKERKAEKYSIEEIIIHLIKEGS
jgi:hypothetical protein